MRSLLIVANASIAENLEMRGANTPCEMWPFTYDPGGGVVVTLSSSRIPGSGLTWGELQTIIGGLWIYHIEGRRNRASFFDIYDVEHGYPYLKLGWGTIRKPLEQSAELALPDSISKRNLPKRRSGLDVEELNTSSTWPR